MPPPFYRVRIVRDDGSDAAPGEIGEIVGCGPITMTGYYKRPDLTAQAIRDGWVYSGDLGYMDDEGYLHLVDRKKDMIDSGGVKVYPRDIEEVAARHPEVREVVVFGIPDEKWGETPIAAVILHPGATISGRRTCATGSTRALARATSAWRTSDHDGLSSQRRREDLEARTARALLGGARTQDLMTDGPRLPSQARRKTLMLSRPLGSTAG